MVITDYQVVVNDLVSTARDLSQVCGSDNIELPVSDVVDKFSAVKQSIHQHRESLDQLPCLSSQDVSRDTSYLLDSLTKTDVIISAK